jgi:hypothetical protein
MADTDLLTSWIALVLGEADKLRTKGVLSIGAEGCTVTFAALTAPAPANDQPAAAAQEDEEPELDALHDPHSYPGGIVPGYPQIDRYSAED